MSEHPRIANSTAEAGDGAAGARRYRMRRRAEQVEQTRRRIVEAAVRLHGSVGPAATTWAAVAEAAGVTRATLYRHFADDGELFAACSAAWDAEHPVPDVTAWAAVADAEERLTRALEETFVWFRGGEAMLRSVVRDFASIPRPLQESWAAREAEVVECLAEPWPVAPGDAARLRAVLAHVTAFPTWDSLVVRCGLPEPAAVGALVAMVRAVAGPVGGRVRPAGR